MSPSLEKIRIFRRATVETEYARVEPRASEFIWYMVIPPLFTRTGSAHGWLFSSFGLVLDFLRHDCDVDSLWQDS
jgi:hypothetical protein